MSIIGDIPVVGVGTGFFEPTKKDTTWLKCFTHSANPSSAINQNNLVFEIPKLYSDWFLFYNRMRVKLTVKLVNQDGTLPDDNFTVAPINAFPQTMFSSVKLFLNETLVSGASDGLYPYYAYTSMLLNNSIEKKENSLEIFGYEEDTATHWDWLTNTGRDMTGGLGKRRAFFGNLNRVVGQLVFQYQDQEHTFFHEVFTDFKYNDTPMISMVGARLEMTLNSPTYYMQCNANQVAEAVENGPYLKIISAELQVPARQMAPSLLLNLEKSLQTKSAHYPLNRMDMRKLSLALGQQAFSFDDIKQVNICPDRITFFIIGGARLTGRYGASPLRASNFVGPVQNAAEENRAARVYLTDMKLMLNNESLENTQRSYTKESLGKQKYLDTMVNLGYTAGEASFPISYQDFLEGMFFCTYDLTRAKLAAESGTVRQDTLQGNLRLDLTFEEALTDNAYLFVMAEYHTKVSVDKNRNVVYNYLS